MSTQSQIAANRENSQLSTGPTSQEGKDKVATNAVKHGLYSEKTFYTLPDENRQAFNDLRDSLIAEFKAETPSELSLCRRLAEHEWLRGRAMRLQSFCFDQKTWLVSDSKMFALYLRYQKMHEKGIADCTKELTRIRKEKANRINGFVPSKDQAMITKAVQNFIKPGNLAKFAAEHNVNIDQSPVSAAPGVENAAKNAA